MRLAVLLLDRPQQPAGLVEVAVVGPAVQRREALHAGAGAAAAVADAVGAGAVPGHADEERAVVAEVGRPPVLRGRQHLVDVPRQRVEVEGLEGRGVVEVRAQRVGLGRCLRRIFRLSWFGHQSRLPPPSVGWSGARADRASAARSASARSSRRRRRQGVRHGIPSGLQAARSWQSRGRRSSRGTGPSRRPRPRRSRSRGRRRRSGRACRRRRNRRRR